MKIVRDVTTWYLAATSGDKKKKKKNERNNVLDVTEILRRKNCRAGALIIHFILLTKGKELVEIGYNM